jgi:DNA end-binding protein Ku
MAETLIETMSAAWQPHKYRDEYRDALMEIIERKAQNEEIADRPLRDRPATKVVELVKVIQESINRNRVAKPQRKKPKRSTAILMKQRRRAAA